MRASTVISSLSILALASAQTTTGQLGDAAAITNNPEGAIYVATLPISKGVRGTVTAQTAPGGAGVAFQITVDGLPTEGGPFSYHLHDAPVPTNGNCSGTLAHLDPYKRGQTPPCDASAPQTCEVGDLSGKHGKINGTSFSASYVDVYASTLQGIGAFFGNRSVVFHLANSTRISCANFTALYAPGPTGGPTGWYPTATSSGGIFAPTSIEPPIPTFTGAAATLGWGVGAVFAGVMGALL